MVEVVPVTVPSAVEERFEYVIHESHPLPQINCFLALKHVLLTKQKLQLCNRLFSRYKRWLELFLLLGILQSMIVPYLPANVGRITGLVGLVEIPALAAAVLSLRYDMIRLLVRTYEFWYLTFLNLTFFVCAFISYHDVRSITLVYSALGFELLPLQDANFRALKFTIKVFFVAAAAHVGLVVYLNLHLIDQWTTFEVFRYGKHALTADNIVSNYLVIASSMLLRNAYRKHRWVRDCNGGETTVVRCIAYRCRVSLSLQHTLQETDTQIPLADRHAQMRLVRAKQVYDSNQILLRSLVRASRIRRFFSKSRWKRRSIYVIGLTGLSLTSVALAYDPKHCGQVSQIEQCDPIMYTAISISSAMSTGLFCGLFASLYQRQLLVKLITSFDFVFLLINITAMLVCISDAFAWAPKSLALFSSWMWIVWAITMDALTPDLRHALRLHRQHLITVVLIFMAFLIVFAVRLIFFQAWDLQDRTLLRVMTLGTTIQVRVIQLFFSCLFSSFPMCLRILWRILTAKHGELILIQGAVEYNDILLAQRKSHRNRLNNQRNHAFCEPQRAHGLHTIFGRFSWLIQPTRIGPAGPVTSLFQVQS